MSKTFQEELLENLNNPPENFIEYWLSLNEVERKVHGGVIIQNLLNSGEYGPQQLENALAWFVILRRDYTTQEGIEYTGDVMALTAGARYEANIPLKKIRTTGEYFLDRLRQD